jgi:uncharacterized membrane protein YhfC
MPDPSGRAPLKLKRTAHDEMDISETVGWQRVRRRRPVHLGYVAALALFIVGPPLILASAPALPFAAALAVGIVLNLVGAYIGYRAVWQQVEIDRG